MLLLLGGNSCFLSTILLSGVLYINRAMYLFVLLCTFCFKVCLHWRRLSPGCVDILAHAKICVVYTQCRGLLLYRLHTLAVK